MRGLKCPAAFGGVGAVGLGIGTGFFNQPQHGICQRTGITRIDADKASAHTRNRGQIMQNKWRVTLVVAFSIGCFAGFGFLPNGSLIYLLLLAAALIISLAAGARHLSLPARIFITTQIFCWNFMLCLLGRTVEPGITRGNTGMVLLYFGIYGFVPGLCLLRLWRWKFGAILLGSLLPVGFALALIVAGIEERVFVIKYRDTGIGPTPRWTVGTHWLAYDHDTGRLYGSD